MRKTVTFGEHVRELREKSKMTLTQVANEIAIDVSLLAKIERNDRFPTKNIIKKIADYFHVNEKELQNDFLSDQIAYKIIDEQADLSILKVAEKKVQYLKTANNGK